MAREAGQRRHVRNQLVNECLELLSHCYEIIKSLPEKTRTRLLVADGVPAVKNDDSRNDTHTKGHAADD